MHSHVDVYNFTSNTWGGRLETPKEMAHSHLGVASDGRFIYVISGQYGPQCSGPVSHSFMLDTATKKWKKMPPLPAPRYVNKRTMFLSRCVLSNLFFYMLSCFMQTWPLIQVFYFVIYYVPLTVWWSGLCLNFIFFLYRYAPATQIWRGRLHVMGGSKGNRHTPGVEHWSIAVRDGKVLEKEWRTEVPIPRGGPHR